MEDTTPEEGTVAAAAVAGKMTYPALVVIEPVWDDSNSRWAESDLEAIITSSK